MLICDYPTSNIRLRTIRREQGCEIEYGPAFNDRRESSTPEFDTRQLSQETTMAFVIQPVVRDVFDFFWTPDVQRKIRRFVHPPDAASQELQQQTWAVEEGVKACLLPVSLVGQTDTAWCYAFVMNGEFAVVRHESYCVYSFVSISPGLQDKLDGVKRLIAEALRVGGEFLDGKAGVDGLFAVPDAQFMRLDGNSAPAPLTPADVSPFSSTPGGNRRSAGPASR